MRPKGPPDAIVARRRRALQLLSEGLTLGEVARRVGCHASSVKRWRDRYARVGRRLFEVAASPGRPSKLSRSERVRLGVLLAQGPLSHGFRTEVWTCAAVASLVRREFGVLYHPDHLTRLLRQLGWSYGVRRAAPGADVAPAVRGWQRPG